MIIKITIITIKYDNYIKNKEKNKLANKKVKYQLQMLTHNSIQDIVFKYRNLILWLRNVDPIKHNKLLMVKFFFFF